MEIDSIEWVNSIEHVADLDDEEVDRVINEAIESGISDIELEEMINKLNALVQE